MCFNFSFWIVYGFSFCGVCLLTGFTLELLGGFGYYVCFGVGLCINWGFDLWSFVRLFVYVCLT